MLRELFEGVEWTPLNIFCVVMAAVCALTVAVFAGIVAVQSFAG